VVTHGGQENLKLKFARGVKVRFSLPPEEKLKRKRLSSAKAYWKSSKKKILRELGLVQIEIADAFKLCKVCGKVKRKDDFYGKTKTCKHCSNKIQYNKKKATYNDDPIYKEERRLTAARWRLNNPQKAQEANLRSSRKRRAAMTEEDRQRERDKHKEDYQKNPEKHKERKRKYYQNNKEKVNITAKKWQDAHPDKVKEIRKGVNKRRRSDPVKAAKDNECTQQWKLKNSNKIKEYSHKYWIENKEAITERSRERKKEDAQKNLKRNNETKKRSRAKRMTEDPAVKIKTRVSTAIYQCIRAGKGKRKTLEILPYTIPELMEHLEKQFTEGMSWDNYGLWHIDHKLPRAAFKYATPDDKGFKLLWDLSNLQPLWALDNWKKKDKILYPELYKELTGRDAVSLVA
jgi:hypothetical protein